MNKSQIKIVLWSAVVLVLGLALWMRFWRITANEFLFYDEGMYLNHSRGLVDLIIKNPVHSFPELEVVLGLLAKAALVTNKALWFFLVSLRAFFTGPDGWYFSRLISACAAVGTMILLFFWARRYFQSTATAVLSVVFLALMPSHVFYSRLGMQESLSCLLFLGSIYLYMYPRKLGYKTLISSFLLVCVFYTNYRMILATPFILLLEVWTSFSEKQPVQWRKLLWHTLFFYILIFMVGVINGGETIHVTFGWMFHQMDMAKAVHIHWISLFSYPYYLFVLEGIGVGILFFLNLFFFKNFQWGKLLPFLLVALQMWLFALGADKGARYGCFVLPFIAAACAGAVGYVWDQYTHQKVRLLTVVFLALTFMVMIKTSLELTLAPNHYEQAVNVVNAVDQKSGILSTQTHIESLYLKQPRFIDCPHKISTLLTYYKQGARYLIIDPQAFISWTQSGERFTFPLDDYLQWIYTEVKPMASFSHLNQPLLTRFVLDHTEDLLDSIAFLKKAPEQGLGEIRVYDLQTVLSTLKERQLK